MAYRCLKFVLAVQKCLVESPYISVVPISIPHILKIASRLFDCIACNPIPSGPVLLRSAEFCYPQKEETGHVCEDTFINIVVDAARFL